MNSPVRLSVLPQELKIVKHVCNSNSYRLYKTVTSGFCFENFHYEINNREFISRKS